MASLISAAPVATGQFQSLDSIRGHALPSDAMIFASATQVNPVNQNLGSYSLRESANALTLTTTGSVPVVTQSPFADLYKEGSLYFNGTGGNYINATATGLMGTQWNTTGLTVEAWVNYQSFTTAGSESGALSLPSLVGSFQSVSPGNYYWGFGANTLGYVTFTYAASPSVSIRSSAPLSTNTWNHIAFSCVPGGTTANIYVNGTVAVSSSISGTPQILSSTPLGLGQGQSASFPINCYVADVRITTGAALYTGASFTVPSAPLSTAATGVTQALIRAGSSAPTIQNGALVFDRGLAQFAQFGAQTFNIATRGFTAVFRYTWNGTVGNFERIFDIGVAGASPSYSYAVGFARAGTGNQYYFYVNAPPPASTNPQATTTAGVMNQGTSYVVACRWNPATSLADIWINGNFNCQSSQTPSPALADFTSSWTALGTEISKTYWASASMNTFAVYNRALSNAEILTATQALNTVPATPQQKTLEIGDINGTPALSVAGDGKVSVQSIGLSSNVLPWPPAAMTGYDTVINGGVYKARASGENGSQYAWLAFDQNSSTYWLGSGTYNSTTGFYTGTASTTDVNGTVYSGEWCQIQLPTPVLPVSFYNLSTSSAPNSWVVLGSRDGVNFSLIQTVTNDPGGGRTNTASSVNSFLYFRWVIIKSTVGVATPSFFTLQVNGTADTSPSLTIAPATTFNTSVATPSLTGIAGSAFVPQDFSSSGLNIPAYVVSNTATVANTVQYSSFGPFAGEGSLYFPGGWGAGVTFPSSVTSLNYDFFATDNTIEMWIYFQKLNQGNILGRMPTSSYGTGGGTYEWILYVTGSNYPSLVWNGTGTTSVTSSTAFVAQTWNHLAVVNSGTSVLLFLNGALVGSATKTTTTYSISSLVNLGAPGNNTGASGYVLNTNITNVRLIRGFAAYTAAFTPSTQPLTAIQGTTQAGTPYGTVLLLRNAPAPGRIQTTRLTGSNSGTVLSFPPAAMTGYSTALNAGYGQGTYVASASSEVNNLFLAWYAFDQIVGNWWTSAIQYNGSSPYNYTGSVTTVDVNGNSYAGEWIQIQLPSAIVPVSYTITQASGGVNQQYSPTKFWILGSRDGTNWSLVDSRTGAVAPWAAASPTFTVTASQAFSYYRLIGNILLNNGTAMSISQIIFNGSIEGVNINPDGKLGIGVSAPVQNLEVAGNALVTGRIGIGSTMPATGTGIYLWSNTSGTASQIFAQGQVYPSNGASVNRDMLSILNNNGGSVNARINLWGDVFNVGPQIDYGAALHRFMHQNLTTFIGGFSNGNLLTGGATTISVDANGYIIRGATSDQRLKSNIVPLTEYGLATVSNLNPVSFEWNDDAKVKFGDGLQYGLVAQDVQQVFPWAVSESQDAQKTLTIDYPKFTIVLINAIKELGDRVADLEQRLA